MPVDVEEVAEHDSSVCGGCGRVVDMTDVEDTNGWRWCSDGKGGLVAFCADCPLPDQTRDPTSRTSPSRT